MKKIKIKGVKTGVNPLGMGCFAIGSAFGSDGNYYAYGTVTEEDAIATLQKAIDMGINLFDTADVYGAGQSEKVLGKVIPEYRDDLVIATKFGSTFLEGKPFAQGQGKNTSEEYIRQAVRDSMRRLQTDYIDIYQLHSSNHDTDDAPRIKLILDDLVSEGLIGGYGWSTDDPKRMNIFGPEANSVQFIINILYKNDRMLDLIEKNDMVGLIRSPLASGTLTGKYTPDYTFKDDKHMLAKVDLNTDRRKLINGKLEQARSLFTEDGRSLIQGQLGYIMAQGSNIIPIPGSKNIDQITENAKTLEYGALSNKIVSEINTIFSELQTTLVKDDGEIDKKYLIKKESS